MPSVSMTYAYSALLLYRYYAAFRFIVMPIAREYSPELILVSAGFDSARGDPLGCCKLTPLGFSELTTQLHDCSVFISSGSFDRE